MGMSVVWFSPTRLVNRQSGRLQDDAANDLFDPGRRVHQPNLTQHRPEFFLEVLGVGVLLAERVVEVLSTPPRSLGTGDPTQSVSQPRVDIQGRGRMLQRRQRPVVQRNRVVPERLVELVRQLQVSRPEGLLVAVVVQPRLEPLEPPVRQPRTGPFPPPTPPVPTTTPLGSDASGSLTVPPDGTTTSAIGSVPIRRTHSACACGPSTSTARTPPTGPRTIPMPSSGHCRHRRPNTSQDGAFSSRGPASPRPGPVWSVCRHADR